jgi:hypothetical protein
LNKDLLVLACVTFFVAVSGAGVGAAPNVKGGTGVVLTLAGCGAPNANPNEFEDVTPDVLGVTALFS